VLWRRWTILCLGLGILLLSGCGSAFEPDDAESDGDGEQEQTDGDGTDFDLRILPQFAYQGDTITDGSIEFLNVEEVRERLSHGDASKQRLAMDFGKDIVIKVMHYDPEALRFYGLKALVSAGARTGERVVTVGITYGDVTVIERGRFYVLPPLDKGLF